MDRKYEKVKVIGQGSFGKCWIVRRRDRTTELYAMKEINVAGMSEKERQESWNEVKVLSLLDHPNIIAYHESALERGKLYIVMDFASQGDLYKKIEKQRGVKFSERQVLDWFIQICLALKTMHDKRILHRDIKTQNIFLTASNIVKLGDFGISRVLRNTLEQARTVVGTPYYLSPEICDNRPYNNKSDVWSLACVLYELITFRHPFEANDIRSLMQKIRRGSYAPIPSSFSPDLSSLLGQMFRLNPRERPSINAILKMPFIRNHMQSALDGDDDGDGGGPPPPVAAAAAKPKPKAKPQASPARTPAQEKARAAAAKPAPVAPPVRRPAPRQAAERPSRQEQERRQRIAAERARLEQEQRQRIAKERERQAQERRKKLELVEREKRRQLQARQQQQKQADLDPARKREIRDAVMAQQRQPRDQQPFEEQDWDRIKQPYSADELERARREYQQERLEAARRYKAMRGGGPPPFQTDDDEDDHRQARRAPPSREQEQDAYNAELARIRAENARERERIRARAAADRPSRPAQAQASPQRRQAPQQQHSESPSYEDELARIRRENYEEARRNKQRAEEQLGRRPAASAEAPQEARASPSKARPDSAASREQARAREEAELAAIRREYQERKRAMAAKAKGGASDMASRKDDVNAHLRDLKQQFAEEKTRQRAHSESELASVDIGDAIKQQALRDAELVGKVNKVMQYAVEGDVGDDQDFGDTDVIGGSSGEDANATWIGCAGETMRMLENAPSPFEMVEKLKMELETALGEDLFLRVYRGLKGLKQRNAYVALADIQDALGDLLGPKHKHFIPQIHRLVLFEENL